MSTILRALQRVEGETGADGGEMGGLREGVVRPGEPLVRERRGYWRLGIISLLAVLLFGFFIWRMIPSEEVSKPTAQLPPAVAAPPEPVSEISSRPAHQPAPRSEEQIAAAHPTPPVERVEVSPPPEEVAAPPPGWLAKTPAPSERIAEPLPAAAVSPPPAAEPEVQPSRPAPAPPAPAPARVATVRPPKVTVEKTIWHPTPARRVARIEVEGHEGTLELHEGDAVGTLVVAEIKPSGVLFLHGGEKLHRKVGGGR